MKKKILTFLFAICLILPCAFILTACGDNPPPDTQPPEGSTGSLIMEVVPQNDIWLLRADANDHLEEGAEIIENGSYSIWFADYYDKDTLEVLYDGETISTLTLLETPGYENKNIGLNVRKIATFSLPEFDPGDHNLTIDVKEEELTVRFVTNDQEFTEEELNILDDYHITSMGGRTFKDMMLNDYRLYTTYSQIITSEAFYSDGIEFTGDKNLGYYVSHQIIKAVDPSLEIHNNYHKLTGNNYSYSFVINADTNFNGFAGFESTNILLTFDKENLKVSNFHITGTNLDNEILSCKVNGI